MSLNATIKSIQDIFRKDAGIDGDAQRIGQLGWMLFFKIYSDGEDELEVMDDDYESPVPDGLRWSSWADQDTLARTPPPATSCSTSSTTACSRPSRSWTSRCSRACSSGVPTKAAWVYERPCPKGYKSYSKTKPTRIAEFEPEKAWWDNREDRGQAWRVPVEEIMANGYNLDISNPNTVEDGHDDPDVLLAKYHKATEAAQEARDALKGSLMEALGSGPAAEASTTRPPSQPGLFGERGQA